MTKPQATVQHKTPDKWHRVSPYAVIHYIVKIVGGLIEHGPQTLAPLLAVIIAGGESRWLIVGYIGVALGVFILVGSFLRYLKFKYRISNETVLVHSGVFKRKRIILNFDRIQNITFKEPIYFRPFNLVVLDIESVGSSGVEASLSGVPRELAEGIRANILSFRKLNPLKTSEAPDDKTQEINLGIEGEEIIKQPIPELIKYGISSNRIWVFAAIGSGTIGQFNFDGTDFVDFIQPYFSSDITSSTLIIAGLVGLVISGVIFILMLASVFGAIFTNYNYHMTHKGDRFHRTRGLFERQETSLPLSKIQTIKIRQPWLGKPFKRFQLHLNKIGFGRNANRKASRSGGHFFIPSVTKSFAENFSKILYPNFIWETLPLKPIHKMYIRKMLLWKFFPIALVPTLFLTITGQTLWGLTPLLILLIVTPFIILRWSKYGFATDGQHGLVQTGFVGHQLTVFPFYKVQNIALSQSPSQKRHGLASVKIKMASSSITIPFMPIEEAIHWRDKILYNVENTNKSWI